jgi:hypothetical protein
MTALPPCPGLDQAVLNVQLLAPLVNHVLVAGFTLTAGK